MEVVVAPAYCVDSRIEAMTSKWLLYFLFIGKPNRSHLLRREKHTLILIGSATCIPSRMFIVVE